MASGRECRTAGESVGEDKLCEEGENSPISIGNTKHDDFRDWSRFSEWVHCMCVVTFDLELGQAIEVVYPEKFALSEQEKTNICYLAFPDSNSGCMGDTQFHVRLRLVPDSNILEYDNDHLSFQHRRFNKQCATVQKADKAHYLGFVYFRQRKESSLPRGYFQKSFIVLTRLPFFSLFYEVVSQLAPRYFSAGFSAIESACRQICDWSPLRTGSTLDLPLFGTVYQTTIPYVHRKFENPDSGNNSLAESVNRGNVNTISRELPIKVIESVNEIDIFSSLSCVLPHINTLWELVLTAEPIVVFGSSPADTSHMVQSLVSTISPLEYCAESRPYFTIHDSEFKEFTMPHGQFSKPKSIIIGVTNPFFVKLLNDWPHMIRIPTHDRHVDESNEFPLHSVAPISARVLSHSIRGSYPANSAANHSRRTNLSDSTIGLITKYKPFLKKDKPLIKKILLGINTKRPDHVQSALLRRNFLELTQSFMIPLERYMASLMPLQKDISPFKSAPSPNQFKQEDFLATLEQSGPHLTSPIKGNWKGLYKRFFNSPNFKGWYETRHRELQETLHALQLRALSGADLNQWAQGKQEVEIIDMIIKLKQKLNLCSTHRSNEIVSDSPTDEISVCNRDFTETRNQLIRQIESMKQSLPDDLKTILFDT